MTTHRAIRKSAFTTYKHCQKKFEFYYNSDEYWNIGEDDETPKSEALIKGSAFHDGADKFFSLLEGRIFTDNLPKTFRDNLPHTGNIDVDKWFDWFADSEKRRYIELQEMKMTGAWFPVARELQIKLSDTIDWTGHVDRIDVIPGLKELQIVEYKTGKSYDMDNKYALTRMNAEIGFYIHILNETKAFSDYKLTQWKVINPTLEKIWTNSVSPITMRAVKKTYDEIVNKIQTKGDFPKNVTPLCKWCPYVNECLYSGDELIQLPEGYT